MDNLLIIGAGVYGLVAMEIAESMGCFNKISFVDDNLATTYMGHDVVGSMFDLPDLAKEYPKAAVAIGNPQVRLVLIQRILHLGSMEIVSLVSPKAHIAPSAKVGHGCIIEPMAVVHTCCRLEEGCIVSSGAVVNHMSTLAKGVHVDCNATVSGYVTVPECTKVISNTCFAVNR